MTCRLCEVSKHIPMKDKQVSIVFTADESLNWVKKE